MQEHPLCPNCLGSISEYYDLFNLLKKDKIERLIKKQKTNIDEADVLENFDEDLQDIFDMMGIELWCCRGRFTAAKDFYEYYLTS